MYYALDDLSMHLDLLLHRLLHYPVHILHICIPSDNIAENFPERQLVLVHSSVCRFNIRRDRRPD